MMGEMTWANHPSRDSQSLTPDRVRKKEFSRAKIARRGYSEEEVQAFLYRVADLRAEIDRLKNWYRSRGTDVSNSGAAQQPHLSVDAINILSRAQQTADAQIAEAESYARRLVDQARQQYEQILQESQQRAEEAASEAVNAYRSSDAVQSSEAEELESRIAYLRTFAEVTQVQLRAVLEGLTHEVNKIGNMPERSRQAVTESSPRYS
jgi:DivIVA domain-containing protein